MKENLKKVIGKVVTYLFGILSLVLGLLSLNKLFPFDQNNYYKKMVADTKLVYHPILSDDVDMIKEKFGEEYCIAVPRSLVLNSYISCLPIYDEFNYLGQKYSAPEKGKVIITDYVASETYHIGDNFDYYGTNYEIENIIVTDYKLVTDSIKLKNDYSYVFFNTIEDTSNVDALLLTNKQVLKLLNSGYKVKDLSYGIYNQSPKTILMNVDNKHISIMAILALVFAILTLLLNIVTNLLVKDKIWKVALEWVGVTSVSLIIGLPVTKAFYSSYLNPIIYSHRGLLSYIAVLLVLVIAIVFITTATMIQLVKNKKVKN